MRLANKQPMREEIERLRAAYLSNGGAVHRGRSLHRAALPLRIPQNGARHDRQQRRQRRSLQTGSRCRSSSVMEWHFHRRVAR
jgi:hypothetical protein